MIDRYCKCGAKAAPKQKRCWACIKRDYREKHPVKAAYQNLKSSAKRRGKTFDLTFEQFKEFAIKTEYIYKKGRSAESYHVDRINPDKGYTLDNIQVLTNRSNVLKQLHYDYNFEKRQMEFWFCPVSEDDSGEHESLFPFIDELTYDGRIEFIVSAMRELMRKSWEAGGVWHVAGKDFSEGKISKSDFDKIPDIDKFCQMMAK
jgi:hypothetical protein